MSDAIPPPPIDEWLEELRERAEREMAVMHRDSYEHSGVKVSTRWDVSVGYEVCVQEMPIGEIRCIKLINWVDGEMRGRVANWNRDHRERIRAGMITRPEDV